MSKPTQLAVPPAAGRESARPVPGPLSARGPIPRGDRASGEEPRARVVRPAFAFREIPLHDSLSLDCPACAGRARFCPCGGIVHLLVAENRPLCSTVGCDAWVGPIAVVSKPGTATGTLSPVRILPAGPCSAGAAVGVAGPAAKQSSAPTIAARNDAATGHAGGRA